MLQSPVTLAQGADQEEVTVQGQVAEEGRLLGADPFQVPLEPGLVAGVAPADGHAMGDAPDRESDEAEAAHFHRMVDEIGVILGRVGAEAHGVYGGRVPDWWQPATRSRCPPVAGPVPDDRGTRRGRPPAAGGPHR